MLGSGWIYRRSVMSISRARGIEQAMGRNLQLLQVILKEINEQKGDERALTLLALPRFEQNLRNVVEALIKCDWRIPASLIRKRAVSMSGCVIPRAERLEVSNLWWIPACIKYDIPYQQFSRDEQDGKPSIPSWIYDQLHRRQVVYPIRLMSNTHTYVIVDWNTVGGPTSTVPGSQIDMTKVVSLAIAKEEYFDFDN